MLHRFGPDRPYASAAKIWLAVVAILLVADLSFDRWFWRIPKLTGTNADFGYQFVVDAQPLRRPVPAGARRVVALGSSVSGSFDPRQVAGLLRAEALDFDVEVHRLLLPAAHPTDYVVYFGDDRLPTPDVVVILFNLVDFLFPGDEGNVNPTLRFALPPWPVLLDRFSALSVSDRLDLFVGATSDIYRYRRPLRSSLQDHARMVTRRARHRTDPRVYGIHPDGFTARRFGLPAASDGRLRLRFHVDPEWLRQRGVVRLLATADRHVLAEVEIDAAGWHELDVRRKGPGRVDFRFDGTWTPRIAGEDDLRVLGARLAPELVPDGGALAPEPFRCRLREPEDIDTFLRMGGARGEAYRQRWHETLEAETRFGQRFRVYRDAKRDVRERSFVVDAEYEAIATLAQRFSARGARVVLVNTPESPLMLAEYGDSAYYAAYRNYFASVAAATAGVTFVDLSEALPAEDFNDLHHPTFVGAIKHGPTYADWVRRQLVAEP